MTRLQLREGFFFFFGKCVGLINDLLPEHGVLFQLKLQLLVRERRIFAGLMALKAIKLVLKHDMFTPPIH